MNEIQTRGIKNPADILILDELDKSENIKEEAWEKAIPEFKRFNIVESEVRNVV